MIYDSGRRMLARNEAARGLAVMLVGASYVPDRRHATVADVSDELTEAARQDLGGVAWEDTDAGPVLRAADAVWEGATIRAAGAVVYSPTTGDLLRYFKLGGKGVVDGEYRVRFPDGVVSL